MPSLLARLNAPHHQLYYKYFLLKLGSIKLGSGIALHAGGDEALLLNGSGHVAEGIADACFLTSIRQRILRNDQL